MSKLASIHEFITVEGHLLDERRFEEWLDLYANDVEYWVPSWDENGCLVDNPETDVSLIYYSRRAGLEDRIFRLGTERSSASFPLPRTTHLATNVLIMDRVDKDISVKSNWATYSYRDNVTHVYHGCSQYVLRQDASELGWKIKKKKIVIQNDYLGHVVDFYSIY